MSHQERKQTKGKKEAKEKKRETTAPHNFWRVKLMEDDLCLLGSFTNGKRERQRERKGKGEQAIATHIHTQLSKNHCLFTTASLVTSVFSSLSVLIYFLVLAMVFIKQSSRPVFEISVPEKHLVFSLFFLVFWFFASLNPHRENRSMMYLGFLNVSLVTFCQKTSSSKPLHHFVSEKNRNMRRWRSWLHVVNVSRGKLACLDLFQ